MFKSSEVHDTAGVWTNEGSDESSEVGVLAGSLSETVPSRSSAPAVEIGGSLGGLISLILCSSSIASPVLAFESNATLYLLICVLHSGVVLTEVPHTALTLELKTASARLTGRP